jgi:hypothetical protein
MATELGMTRDTLTTDKMNPPTTIGQGMKKGATLGTPKTTFGITTEIQRILEISDRGTDLTMNRDMGTRWLPLKKCTKTITSIAVEMITLITNLAFFTKCA